MKRALQLLAAVALGSSAQPLTGVVDLHAHCAPDSAPRSIGALELVRLAKQRGLRGIVLKSHHEATANLAWVARREVPGIEVWGGIALNRAVGGLNPAAIERMAALPDRCGRVVWMQTFDIATVPVTRAGRLLPEAAAVLEAVARHKLVLATGHVRPEESLLLVKEGRKRGIGAIIVTHPMPGMPIAMMKEAAAEGAYLEFMAMPVVARKPTMTIKELAEAIRAVGLERSILASDLGQAGNPLHPDGLEATFRGLRGEGFTVEEVERIAKRNPARLMGLE